MHLYTKAWVTGQLTDAQWEAVAAAGATHSFELGQTLPVSVLALSTGEGFGGFHDAVLISAVEGPATTLEFCTGDLQRGYFTVALVFSEAEVATRGRPLRRIVRGLFTELLYDELDIVGERFEWRAIYSDYNVARVRFADVDVSYVPRVERYWGRRGPSRWNALLRGCGGRSCGPTGLFASGGGPASDHGSAVVRMRLADRMRIGGPSGACAQGVRRRSRKVQLRRD